MGGNHIELTDAGPPIQFIDGRAAERVGPPPGEKFKKKRSMERELYVTLATMLPSWRRRDDSAVCWGLFC